jgi:hypothetical protein
MTIGSISCDQYDYWNKREESLIGSLQSPEEQDSVPEEFRLNHFTEYQDVLSVFGVDMSSEIFIQITDENEEIYFDGDFDSLSDIFLRMIIKKIKCQK